MSRSPRIRVALIGYEAHPSMRLRLEQYMPALSRDGYEIVRVLIPQGSRSSNPRAWNRLREVIGDVDIVVVQRLLEAPLVRILRSARMPTVFDIDDATYYIRPGQVQRMLGETNVIDRLRMAYRSAVRGNPYFSSRKRQLDRMIDLSSVVIAGNETVRDDLVSFGCEEVIVIPTAVPVENRPPKTHGSARPVRIGWIGTRNGLEYLSRLEPAFRDLAAKVGDAAELVVCTSREYRSPNLATEFIPWSVESESQTVESFDIGIMPLSDDPYSRGKSAFKAILCMSFGVPVVISPVGANATLVRHGENGFLATTDHQWSMYLERLINEPELRTRIGTHAFQTIKDDYSASGAYRALTDVLDAVRRPRAAETSESTCPVMTRNGVAGRQQNGD